MATRAELRTRAETRADQDGGDFPSLAQKNTFLDEAGKEVFADLVMAGWPIDYSTTPIIADGVTRTYAFGGTDTVFSATMVYTSIGGQFTELKRVNPGHVAALRSAGGTGGFSHYYEVRTSIAGAIVEFFPKVAGTYFVDYIVDFPGFSSDGSLWLGPPRSDELIVLKAAAKGVRKEGRVPDAQSLDGEYDKLLLKVKELASWFDQRNAAEMRDSNPVQRFDGVGNHFAGPGGIF